MVRLEKILYEQILNNKVLGRARKMTSPTKWFYESRQSVMSIAAHKLFQQGITGKLFKLVEPAFAWLFYKWPKEIANSRGLALEDFFVFQDRELRRCMLFENVARNSLHPFQLTLFQYRRARYYKVERAVRGFIVPRWARQEGEERLFADTVANKTAWDNFVYDHFYSDMTPVISSGLIGRWHPLEAFNCYGLVSPEAWDRYFYNEILYDQYSAADAEEANTQPFGALDLTKEGDRQHFESEVRRFIKLYPGSIVQEGQEFDFQQFYLEWSLANNKEIRGQSKDQKQIEDAKAKLSAQASKFAVEHSHGHGGHGGHGHGPVGTRLPAFLRAHQRTKALLS